MVILAPVVVFAYRRPHHLARTLAALAQNHGAEQTDVRVFCDGAADAQYGEDVRRVKAVARAQKGFKSLRVVGRNENLGLARSIITGVKEMLVESERVIVLEDDLVTSPYFLRYMNEALARYESDDRVVSVHGYSYPTGARNPFFLRGADCWGWATWRRGWRLFNPDGAVLLDELRRRNLTRDFDFNGTYPFTKMLEEQVAGRIDSWAIRWYASAFLAGRLTLYPGQSLVQNIGNDGSGTHTGATNRFDAGLRSDAPVLAGLRVHESRRARREFERFFRGGPAVRLPRTAGRLLSRLRFTDQ